MSSWEMEFTEKEVALLKQAVRISAEDGSLLEFGSAKEIERLARGVDATLDAIRKAKSERRRSLAIERRAMEPR